MWFRLLSTQLRGWLRQGRVESMPTHQDIGVAMVATGMDGTAIGMDGTKKTPNAARRIMCQTSGAGEMLAAVSLCNVCAE